MNKPESRLVPALKETLFEPTYDLVVGYAEIGMDALLESEAYKQEMLLNKGKEVQISYMVLMICRIR